MTLLHAWGDSLRQLGKERGREGGKEQKLMAAKVSWSTSRPTNPSGRRRSLLIGRETVSRE